MEEDTTHLSHEKEESVINKNDHILRQDTRTTYRSPKIETQDFNEYIEEEPITIILSSQNWIRSQKGHIELNSEFKLREGDTIKKVIHAKTNDKIIFFSENGSFFSILGNKLPSGRGFGEPLSKFFDLISFTFKFFS